MKILFIPIAVIWLSIVPSTRAAVIASHSGSNDPSSEGFVLSDSTAVAGPITADLGRNAWSVDSTGGPYNHRFSMSASAEADANSNGWTLTMTVRLVDISDALDFGVYADYATSTGIYQIGFGTQPDGDPIIGLNTDSGFTSFAFEGGGTGYHTYQVAYDPAAGSATLSIDGINRLSGWTGRIGPAPALVNFGSYGSGHANWSEITFSSVPEPGTALMAMIACCLGSWRRKKFPTPFSCSSPVF
ncbi:MAG: hlyA 6 [Akkermansiaceae bacterium]|nr:hlyA 6 [Akkermansiaceae bacterium]